MVVAGCGAEPSPSAALPTPPSEPDGWRTVTSDEGDVVARLPREFVVESTAGGIGASPDISAPMSAEWIVIGPTTHELAQGDSIDDWVNASNWLTAQQDGAVRAVDTREVLLPAGPAIEYRAIYDVEGHAAWTILYAIDVGGDISVVRFGGDGPMPEELPEDYALIRDLLTFPRP